MRSTKISRRSALQGGLAGLGLAALGSVGRGAEAAEELPPVRTLTRGPLHHWFGYYDKLEFDPTSRYVLGMQTAFEHRSPRAEDTIGIGMVDTGAEDRWISLGKSSAWSWQQGCMLQWIPGSPDEILWNDRAGDAFVCRVRRTGTDEMRTLPEPIYTLSPDGTTGIAPDFRRLNDVRPGYGYAGLPDPHRDEARPDGAGIRRVDLKTGRGELLFSVRKIAEFGEQTPDMADAKHWFNHLLYAPDGKRFVFLHRWRPTGKTGFRTRMITVDADGGNPFVIDPSGETSHFVWRDPEHILAWTKPIGKPAGFYVFRDKTDHVEQIGAGVMTVNGHCTYLTKNQWILNDTYPDKDRLQHPYLYHIPTGKRVPLGHFLSPKEYSGEWRCDTHPRSDASGTKIVIDSPHTGQGRQLHLIDVSKIVG